MTRGPVLGSALLPLAVLLFEAKASSDAPVGHYTLTTGTALDTRTNLRWMRGFAAGSPSTWAQAAAACQALKLESLTGWRLPNARELETIYDPRISDANMWDGTVFKAPVVIAEATLWSSTPVVGDATKVEARNYFERAFEISSRHPLSKESYAGVRCVRDP